MELDKTKCPFVVPAFEVKPLNPPESVKYYWWSWHPNYPYWSRSCWGGKTIEEAQEKLSRPGASSMDVYHNKLIKEENGTFTEVMDCPCKRLEYWWRIYENKQILDKGEK